ncbi:NLI interacting factor-like phosphatase/Zinc finger C-x8-C-x5-C-x3-H type (and similar), putative [Leishmania guyanensis]
MHFTIYYMYAQTHIYPQGTLMPFVFGCSCVWGEEMNSATPQVSPGERDTNYVRRERFEIDQYVRVRVTDTRYSIGVVTTIDENQDLATVETRNGYEVTVPTSALRRAFLLVLDLNGVLVARGRGGFVLRPNVSDFLKFVFSNFVVAVWTSGLQRSSDPIIEHVFGNYRDLLLFTLFRDACMSKPSVENPYGTEKNLQVIFDRYPHSFHSVNTIIIDDSPDKCSHPDIALCPIPFKDPVTQVHDEGLLQAMEVLKEVLLLDSGVPLILAAERRLQQLAKQQHEDHPGGEGKAHEQRLSKVWTPAGASVCNSHELPSDMEEVELWKKRLCCDQLQGKCLRSDRCPFSHDADDGRPCSRKSGCRKHGSRWPKTREEVQLEEQRREARNAMLQRNDNVQQQRGARPGQPQKLPRQSNRASHRRRGDADDGAEWATETTGFSHTGDPVYDNMIDQQRRQGASAVKAMAATSLGGATGAASQNVRGGSSATFVSAQPQIQPQTSQVNSSLSLFFQTATASSAPAPPLEPFSTRPNAPTVSATNMSVLPQQQQRRTSITLVLDDMSSRRGNNGNGIQNQRGGGGRQQQLQRQASQQQSQQLIHITGEQGNSTAVVSKLQALIGQR